MGGARCSYHNCTTRSDKKTHMFHFPVFDKIRCHKWITNAQKLNYLDLKLSQLKNRVICQHHFTDDAFMNETKGKLKNTAVPTKNGPFCNDAVVEIEDRKNPINLDDIENDDYLTNMEKKAHFSVKYGDFLTNELSETISLTPNHKSPSKMLQDKDETFNLINKKYDFYRQPPKLMKCNNAVYDKAATFKRIKVLNKEKNAPSDATTLFQNKLISNPKVVAIEFEELNLNSKDQGQKNTESYISPNEQSVVQSNSITNNQIENKTTQIPKTKKVKIISEKKISKPLPIIKGEFQPVSPSMIIRAPDFKKKPSVEYNGTEIQTFYLDFNNPQQLDSSNVQGLINSSMISTPTPFTEQMSNNDSIPPIRIGDQIDFSNQNMELLIGNSKQPEAITTDILDRMHLKQDLELLNDVQNISIVPVEYETASSTNAPCVFTLSTDVPQDSTLLTSSLYVHNVGAQPKDVQMATMLSTNSETNSGLTENLQNIADMAHDTQNNSGITKSKQNILNKKLPTSQNKLSPNKPTKSKMPPEKLAAIEEKRKFNMKLRDIIDSYLNNVDEGPETTKLTPAVKKKLDDSKVRDHFSKDPRLPTAQENNIAYLEARLQRMENTLMNKIDQNSNRITDLKKIIKPTSSVKKSAYTQTPTSAEATKKQLYQQISQYLRPETNSLIYEELFLSQYPTHFPESRPSPKKRRRIS